MPTFPPSAGNAITATADPWAQDLLEAAFPIPIKNDTLLQSVDAYTITPLDGGIPVTVLAVQTGNAVSAEAVYLVTTTPTVGKLYRVEFQNLYAIDGSVVSPIDAKFYGRPTKQDSIIQSRPSLYDMTPDSTLRKIFNAIGKQDDFFVTNTAPASVNVLSSL